MKYINHVVEASKIVFAKKKYIFMGIISFISFFIVYIFTLPATYTGGRVGLLSLSLLTFRQGLFSFFMALFIAFIIPFTIFASKMGGKAAKGSTATGFIASLLPPIFCCTPFIPALFATLVTLSPFFNFGGAIQGFIATNETFIFIGATILLGIAVVQTAKSTKQCFC